MTNFIADQSMENLPQISIVVPSFNQAQFLTETLQSIVLQDYPSLEIIIQDGGSRDGSIEIAKDFVRRFPMIFQLFVEKDSGQADALNRGFARTSGEIMAFLNSDDTYFPRILHRVATEIDPARDRYIVMGRCMFTGEGSIYVGIEHPAEYNNHFQQLAIWKRGFNTIPQPSVFWHRSVWSRCGGFDVNEHHALDYDLFCRFSRHYTFHRVDELFSQYRMHNCSKSSRRTEAEVLELSIKVSKKHWGSWMSLLRWRCEFSYWLYNKQLHESARHHARQAEQAYINRDYGSAFANLVATLFTSPKMARDRLLFGWFAAKAIRIFQKLVINNDGFTGRYADGWIGPIYREQISVPEGCKKVVVSATHQPRPSHKKIKVLFYINGRRVDSKKLAKKTNFSLPVDVQAHQGQMISLEIRSNSSFSPSSLYGNDDRRQLSLQLTEVNIVTD